MNTPIMCQKHRDKPIELLCMNENCQADKRIMCVLCLKQQHENCNLASFIEEGELYQKLRALQQDLNNQINLQTLDILLHLQTLTSEAFDRNWKHFQQILYQELLTSLNEQVVQQFISELEYDSKEFIPLEQMMPEIQLIFQNNIRSELESLYKSIIGLSQQQFNTIKEEQVILQQPLSEFSTYLQNSSMIIQARNYSILLRDLKQYFDSQFHLHVKYLRQNGETLIIEKQFEVDRILGYTLTEQSWIDSYLLLKNYPCKIDNRIISQFESILQILRTIIKLDQVIQIKTQLCQQDTQLNPGLQVDHNIINGDEDCRVLEYGEQYLPLDAIGDIQVLCSKGSNLIIYNVKLRILIGSGLLGHTDDVTSGKYSLDGKFIASSSLDCSIRCWDAHTQNLIIAYTNNCRLSVLSVEFSHCGDKIVSSFEDHTIRIWNWKLNRQMRSCFIDKKHGQLESVSYSLNDKQIISVTSENNIKIWDIRTRKKIKQFKSSTNFQTYPDLKSQKVIVKGNNLEQIKIQALNGYQLDQLFTSRIQYVKQLNISKFLTQNIAQTITIWDQFTAEFFTIKQGNIPDQWPVSFSNDGRYLITGGNYRGLKISRMNKTK